MIKLSFARWNKQRHCSTCVKYTMTFSFETGHFDDSNALINNRFCWVAKPTNMETEFSQRIHTLYRISIVGAILRIIVDKKLEHWLVNIFFFHLHVFAAKKWLVLKWVRLIRALIKSKLVPFYLIYSNSFGTSHSIMSLITTTYTQTKRSHTMNTFSDGFSELLFVPFVYYFHISTKRPVNILN